MTAATLEPLILQVFIMTENYRQSIGMVKDQITAAARLSRSDERDR